MYNKPVVSGMKIANVFFFSGKEAKALLFLEKSNKKQSK